MVYKKINLDNCSENAFMEAYIAEKTGDFVRKGEKIAMLYTNTESLLSEAAECFESAIALDKVAPGKMALIHKIIF